MKEAEEEGDDEHDMELEVSKPKHAPELMDAGI